jgi:zeaxanthin epoxidase
VIQQIFLNHGMDKGTVRINSRVTSFEDLGGGRGVKVTCDDGTEAHGDVLIGADGIWSSVRRVIHGLGRDAGGFAASGAAGGALDDAEAKKMARDSLRVAAQAERRYSGFTCYAGLTHHRASNVEEVSYQVLLGKDKYFVSTDAGGERQQWFALIRTPPGEVDPEPCDQCPCPKVIRLNQEFADGGLGDSNGDLWDPFALELINSTPEASVKRRDLYDGPPLMRNPAKWMSPWSEGAVAICGDAAHPMMPNLGQGGCQSTEDGYRLVEELAKVKHTSEVPGALAAYSRRRVLRTGVIQGLAQLGSDLLTDFDKMMTIPLVGPFFLALTQLSMPFLLRFLYTPEF